MATQNVSATRSGTGWTIDVTLVNLDADLTIKDFFILHNGTPYANQYIDYAKTTATTLTYTGSSLASTTIEVRRKTPSSVVQTVAYASRISSSLWNKEFDRVQRRAEEYELNGVGAAFAGVIPTPKDDAYPTGWDGDITYSPTRNALFDIITTLAPKASPALTGTPTAPTATTADNSTQIATTAHVKNNLASYAPLASPGLTGTPTAPTAGVTTNNTQIATTAFVQTYDATTQAAGTANQKVATTAFVGTAVSNVTTPLVVARRTTNTSSGLNDYTIVWESEVYDTDSAMGSTTFTVPTGKGGCYHVGATVLIQPSGTGSAALAVSVNATSYRLDQKVVSAGGDFTLSGSIYLQLAASDTVTFSITEFGTAMTYTVLADANTTRCFIQRVY